MSCLHTLDEWTTIIRTHLPRLSKPQATVLALWSLGMALARSCALTAVGTFLAAWLDRQEQSVRQQLRECCYEADAKRGAQRQALVVEDCFVPRLGWVLHRWQGMQLALALDATTLGTRFTVLASRVVSRGCAIPVAWTILPANQPEPWRHHWLRRLRQLRPAIPQGYAIKDAALGAFAVFFTQSPSFLAYQRTMQQAKGRSNADSLFGMEDIPCDNQIRTLLDPVAPGQLFPVFEGSMGLWNARGMCPRFAPSRVSC